MKQSIYSLIILVLLMLNCNRDFTPFGQSSDSDYILPSRSSQSLIPFALGNRWTYSDSLVSDQGLWVRTFEVSVIDSRIIEARTWWRLQNAFNPSIAATEFAEVDDSTFSLQYTESPDGLKSIYSLEYILPSSTDSCNYYSLFYGDALIAKTALRLTKPYSVLAGTYSDCVLYTYKIFPEHYREILKPGIGILRCEIRADSSVWGAGWHRMITLLDYSIGG